MLYKNKIYRMYLDLLTGKVKEVDFIIKDPNGSPYMELEGFYERKGFGCEFEEFGRIDCGILPERFIRLTDGEFRIRTKSAQKLRSWMFKLDKWCTYDGMDELEVIENARDFVYENYDTRWKYF